MYAWEEHANSMQKDPPLPGVEPQTFLLQGNSATNCATVQPFRNILKLICEMKEKSCCSGVLTFKGSVDNFCNFILFFSLCPDRRILDRESSSSGSSQWSYFHLRKYTTPETTNQS
ncbi:hypothetical protein GOODEAATRI_024201 [Goodea atripinnis]|uniref:Uncharacterized protein n=1 Tax=Goodea atripinnis TaxID=208336 RepID=A0ABV0ND93_9TELE